MNSQLLNDQAATAIGQIVVTLSRLEFNLTLYLANAVGGVDPASAEPVVSRLRFKQKVDALADVVRHKFQSEPACLAEFAEWHSAMDRYRVKRNAFVHGRWAFVNDECINVESTSSSGSLARERRYGVPELKLEAIRASELAASFHKWASNWPL